MSLKLQQTSTGGSSSGRRIGPASKTNRIQSNTNDVIDVDAIGIDDKPLSQIMNQQKSTANQSSEKSDMKKSLIPISTNEKNSQGSLNTTSLPSSPPNEIKNGKETNSSTPSATNDSKNNSKNTEKNGHNNDQLKIFTTLPPQQSPKESKSTNGHKNDDSNNKKSNQQPNNGNEDQLKISKTKEEKLKSSTESITVSESEKPKSSKKLSDKEKKKTIEDTVQDSVQQQPTPLKRVSQRTVAAAQANASLSSLANEKELKGFSEIGDEEMESILLQIDTSDVVEKPTKSLLTPTKMATEKKMEQEINKKNIETKKIDIATTKTTIATKKSPIKPITIPFSQPPITSTPDANKQQHSYLPRPSSASNRSISGRRSLRPFNKEYSFTNTTNYRDSYRKLQTEFDCTGNTSLNVTVGSEIAQPELTSSASSSSFSFFGRGTKRERISPSQQYVQKSPEHCQLINDGDQNELDTSVSKRARLDFSGFFGIVASPVTMLRARLSRAKIQQNIPKFNDDIEEGVENFSGIIGEKKKENEIILDNKDNCEDEDVEIEELSMEEEEEDDENEKNNMKNIKDVSDATIASEDNEIIVTEHENRRSRCLLM